MITIKLEKDQVTPHLRKLLKESETNSPLGRVLGRAASNELKKHFRERNKTGNKLGGKRTNFWSRIAESVQSPVPKPGEIVIPVSHPAIAQKVFGGTITPKKAKSLAIPVHPKAYGKSPRAFPDLTYFRMKSGVSGLGMLTQQRTTFQGASLIAEQKRTKKSAPTMKAWKLDIYYILRKSVTQTKDSDALPADAKVAAAMTKAGEIYLRGRK